jgi:hypothetical protein
VFHFSFKKNSAAIFKSIYDDSSIDFSTLIFYLNDRRIEFTSSVAFPENSTNENTKFLYEFVHTAGSFDVTVRNSDILKHYLDPSYEVFCHPIIRGVVLLNKEGKVITSTLNEKAFEFHKWSVEYDVAIKQ